MTEKLAYDSGEISLLGIYEFFRDGWKTLVALSVLGLSVGIITAFVLPEKFQASVLIEPAFVGKKDKNDMIQSVSVESVAVLAEKMKVPTYYSLPTIKACRLSEVDNPAEELVKRLGPNVGRNSTYVSLTFKAESPALAKTCLENVLNDVAANQALLAKPVVNNLQADLESAEDELKTTTTERDQLRKMNPERLSQAKTKLAAAERFVEAFTKDSSSVKSTDPQFSAPAVLLPALMAKQAEIQELERQIYDLSLSVASNITEKDQDLRKIVSIVSELKNALMPPITKPATFAAPVYAPNSRAGPNRSLIMLMGLIGGGCLGLLLMVGISIRKSLLKQLNAA